VFVTFNTNGNGLFYVNNTLIGTYSCGNTLNSSGLFGIGCSDISQTSAFNGYIDDFRIWNSAVAYNPVGVVTPTGTMSYVPGAVGQTALNLVNPPAGSGTNYVNGGWALSATSNFTVSFCFNTQSINASDSQVMFSSHGAAFVIYIENTNRIRCYMVVFGGATVQIGYSSAITANTWYHVYAIFQSNSVCSFYLNNVLIGSATNVGGMVNPATNYLLGVYAAPSGLLAYNGYIDDFRLYNSAIPYSSLIPANYTHLAVSGNGSYRMAAHQLGSQSGRLLLSSDSGASWAPQTAAATPGAWSSLSASNSGQYLTAQSQPVVQPNQSNLAAATWSQQGVTYTASASSTLPGGGFEAYRAFDMIASNRWISAGGMYNGNGIYIGGVNTIIQGIGAVAGEWLQLQVSVPLVFHSYSYTSGDAPLIRLPKQYYIVGSNDGSTWFPLQYVYMIVNPYAVSTAYKRAGNYMIINYTGNQTIFGDINGYGNTISYPTSISQYNYFRLVIQTTYSGNDGIIDIGEFIPNFIGGCIMPNQSGLAASTWLNSGVSWAASASSINSANFAAQYAFNNYFGSVVPYSWASPVTYSTTTGSYYGTAITNIQGGVGTTYGEWLQLQCSIPLVLQSYRYACGAFAQLPKIYIIVGSNDGSSWYPLQYVSMTTNPLTANFSSCSTNIIMNYTGTQTIQGNQTGSGSTTAYAPYVTQAWQYFRVIFQSIWPANGYGAAEFGEFLPIFTAGQNSSTNYGLTWTPSIQTGDAFNVTKNLTVTSAGTGFAQLPAFTPVAQGVTVSCWFTLQSTPGQWSRIFDASLTTPNPTNFMAISINTNRTVNFEQNINGSDSPFVTSTTVCQIGTQYHVVWTIDGSGNHRYYFNGVQDASTGSGVLNIVSYPYVDIGKSEFPSDPYPNMTVRDFRMFNRALNAAEVTALYNNVNYGQPAVGPLALSDSGEYALAAFDRCAEVGSGYLSGVQNSRWSNPLLAGISGPIVDTAVSQTGREMVLVTAGAQNNVYYSTDYGASFSGLTLGTSSLASSQTPLARLTLDNTNVDSQGALTPAAGAGTVTYSSSVYTVGTHSALFTQNTPGLGATTYLNYTVPASLNQPSAITIACWIYPTTLVSNSTPIALHPGAGIYGFHFYITSSGSVNLWWSTTTNSVGSALTSTATISTNVWSHLAVTFSSGTFRMYLNGAEIATTSPGGNLCGNGGGNLNNLLVGAAIVSYNAYSGYVDDVRIHTTALSASEIQALATTPPAMVACSISNDGSYLSVTNSAGAVYELNKNSNSYTLAIGNQAGAVNQGSNAIAIGNGAGAVNQSANSIVLNASGSALGTGAAGFYVSPIATTAGLPMDLLGYGSDSQVVKTGVVVLPGGNVGVGKTNPKG